MNRNRIKKSAKLIVFALFIIMLLFPLSSCLTTGAKDETELIEYLLQKIDALDGEMTVVTKEGENVTITITKGPSIDSQADDNTADQPKSTDADKDSPGSADMSDILPSLESIEDVFQVLGVWEDAHVLHEKGFSWSHAAAKLGYDKDTMYAELLEIAEVRLKNAKGAGLITNELFEKKSTYFNEIALKWVKKIFTDTGEEKKAEETEIEKFDGVIKAIDGHIWKVIVKDKIRVVDVSEAKIIREPGVGLKAFVVGIEKDNIIIALEVEIEDVEEEEEAAVIDFNGTIKTIDGHIWKVIVEDEIRIVDVSEAVIRVEPETGLRVLIAGIVEDDITIALEIDEAEE